MLYKHWFVLFTLIKFGKEKKKTHPQTLQLMLQHLHHAVSEGQAGFLQPRAGLVGAASTQLVSFQRLFKPLVFPQTKELKAQLN